MGNRVITESECEICGAIERQEGALEPDSYPKGWRRALVCPKHTKVAKKVRGPDRKPRSKAQQGAGEASEDQSKETAIPEPTRAKKGRHTNDRMALEKAAASRENNHILCPGCTEKAKCVKVFQEAADCFDSKDKAVKV